MGLSRESEYQKSGDTMKKPHWRRGGRADPSVCVVVCYVREPARPALCAKMADAELGPGGGWWLGLQKIWDDLAGWTVEQLTWIGTDGAR